MPKTFYRIVRSDRPQLEDFKSAKELGKPLMKIRYQREWSEAISVYDDFDHAVQQAIANRLLLGDSIATIELPDEAGFEVAQTTRDPRHFSIYASAERILEFVHEPVIRIVTDQQGQTDE